MTSFKQPRQFTHKKKSVYTETEFRDSRQTTQVESWLIMSNPESV